MGIYAIVAEGIVENTIIADSAEIASLFVGKDVIEVTVKTKDAFINGTYVDGIFYPVKPFVSWVWNADFDRWESPTPYPVTDIPLIWDETSMSWIEA